MDEKIIITPEQAATLLPDGDEIHTYRNPAAGLFMGADWPREDIIKTLASAHAIEIAGPNCQAMGHGLAVWETPARLVFFATDKDRIAAFDASATRGGME